MTVGINLLIVDDDKDLLMLVEKHLLRRYPEIHVVAVESAQDALQLIEETVFDAIVCDYYLGPNDMNGLELLEWLRGSGNTSPFVMFTEDFIRLVDSAKMFRQILVDAEGNIIQMIEYNLDITNQRLVEQQLAEESKKASLYMDMLAHDIANQLQIISGSAELMSMAYDFHNQQQLIEQVKE